MTSMNSAGEEIHTPNIKMKLITTRVMNESEVEENTAGLHHGVDREVHNEVHYQLHRGKVEGDGRKKGGCFYISCGGGGLLALEEVQPAGKKVMKAKNFFNGLRGRKLMYVRS